MTTLEPKAGFPWVRVRWSGANEPQPDECSLCGWAIGEDEVPLMLWDEQGNAAVFCDACMAQWWGFSVPLQYPGEAGDSDL